MRKDMMMQGDQKSTELRLRECADIRNRLRSLGLLTLPEVAQELKTRMNAFVSGGGSDAFVLRVEELRMRIILAARARRQSGVELLQK